MFIIQVLSFSRRAFSNICHMYSKRKTSAQWSFPIQVNSFKTDTVVLCDSIPFALCCHFSHKSAFKQTYLSFKHPQGHVNIWNNSNLTELFKNTLRSLFRQIALLFLLIWLPWISLCSLQTRAGNNVSVNESGFCPSLKSIRTESKFNLYFSIPHASLFFKNYN